MFGVMFDSLKAAINNASKSTLAFAAIGLTSLLASVVIATNIPLGAPQANQQTTDQLTANSDTQKIKQPATSSDDPKLSTNNTAPATATSKPAADTKPATFSNAKASTPQTTANNASNPKTTPAAPVKKADYNLNETWYFATSSTSGTYNTCWPTPIDTSNDDQCFGGHSPSFEGIGIAKTGDAARNQAEDQAFQKAAAQHVEPRKGGTSEPVILSETLCAQYGLSCGRW